MPGLIFNLMFIPSKRNPTEIFTQQTKLNIFTTVFPVPRQSKENKKPFKLDPFLCCSATNCAVRKKNCSPFGDVQFPCTTVSFLGKRIAALFHFLLLFPPTSCALISALLSFFPFNGPIATTERKMEREKKKDNEREHVARATFWLFWLM